MADNNYFDQNTFSEFRDFLSDAEEYAQLTGGRFRSNDFVQPPECDSPGSSHIDLASMSSSYVLPGERSPDRQSSPRRQISPGDGSSIVEGKLVRSTSEGSQWMLLNENESSTPKNEQRQRFLEVCTQLAPSVEALRRRLDAAAETDAILVQWKIAFAVQAKQASVNVMIGIVQELGLWKRSSDESDDASCTFEDTTAPLEVIASRLYRFSTSGIGDLQKPRARTASYILDIHLTVTQLEIHI